MKKINKILSITFIYILLLHSFKNITYAVQNVNSQAPIKAAVFLNDFNDQFISTVMKNLEDIQKENPNKIEYTFFDAKGNQAIKNENIDKALNNKFNLFVLNPVTTNLDALQGTLNKIIQKNIPLILYYANTPSIVNFIRGDNNAVVIDTYIDQSGILEGKILSDAWNANKDIFDKNNDGIIQYILLNGPLNSPETIARTKYSIQTINESGIKTQELLSVPCNWEEDCAKTAIESNFLSLGDKIEAIISNNDAMAIGAIKSLQKYGYNNDDKSKYIPIVGIDGLPEAKKLINEGIMTGTVVQDPSTHSSAIYKIGMNLVTGNAPLADTNYKFDQTGITVKLPYYEYIK